MSKFKKIFSNVRVWIVFIFLLLMVVAIHPNPFAEGVAIRSVAINSSAAIAGIQSPKPTAAPMSRERILAMNNVPIHDIEDYYSFVAELEPNRTVQIKTTKGLYKLVTKAKYEEVVLNETVTKTVTEEVFDEKLNKTINTTKVVKVPKTEKRVVGTEDLGLSVYNAPKTNIRKGMDLQGGTRVLLQPEKKLDADEMGMLIENMKYRLNVYGLSDVSIREASDLSGNQYVRVEIAGAKEEEAKELLARQGKFEAKIGNETVFKGGEDIKYVCRSADCAGIDPQFGCGQSGEQWFCRFRFAITLSPEAAKRQAELTKNLDVVTEGEEQYLSQKLYLYLDDALVDELNIAADLKGRETTDIAISGSGVGMTKQEAISNSLINMKRLQTILVTGSLPVKLNIAETSSISAIFGEELVRNALFVGLVAIVAVELLVFLRYKKLKVALPIIFVSVSEIIMLLGVAALIGWNIDLAAIAGIIIAVGTGVDDQIIITDEMLRGEKEGVYDWKARIKRAFFIVMGAYFTVVVAMLPLWFAGAGLLRGFAITTLIGVSIGVFITRPAFAQVIEILLKE